MVLASVHILLYTAIFLLVGLYKPKWALFFLKNPTRFLVSSIALIGFMIGATVYGEGHKQELLTAKQEAEKVQPVSEVPEAK